MNKTYKVLFNRVRGVATAVSEIASSRQARKRAVVAAAMVAVGAMAGSAMAAGADIVIDKDTGARTPSTWSNTNYVGVDGKVATIGADVINSIKTNGEAASNVYGVKSASAITIGSLSGGIDLKTTGSSKAAYGISFESSGTSKLGTDSATGLGNIAVQTEKGTAIGIVAMQGTNTVNFVSGSSITAKCTDENATNEVYGVAFGKSAMEEVATGTTSINGLGSVNVESTKGSTYGILSNPATGTAADGANFSVVFGTGNNDGTITSKSAGYTNPGYGIYSYSGAYSTSSIMNVKTIQSSTLGTYQSSYGIYILGGGNTTVTFTGLKPSITAMSNGFSATGIGIDDKGNNYIGTYVDANGKLALNNQLAKIEAIGGEETRGIYALNGDNTIFFKGSDSSITAKSSGGNASGIAFGNKNNWLFGDICG